MTTSPNSQLQASRLSSVLDDVWVGPISAIPSVLADFGVDPQSAFSQASVDFQKFQKPDSRLPLKDIGRLLKTCATLTDCDHFGLLVGQRFEIANIGPLGVQMRNSATVGGALNSLLKHLHLFDRGATALLLTKAKTSVILGYSFYQHGLPAIAHALAASIANGDAILRNLCGPSWKPLRVQFSFKKPNIIRPYRQAFRSSVVFDAEVSGIVFASSWLERPIDGADPSVHALVTEVIQDVERAAPGGFAERVQGVLPQMVLNGTESASAVAHFFAIHERTLRRRLKEEGRNFQDILNQTRFELAQQLLENTGLSVEKIASVLRYKDPNAFSRAFRNWATLSPTQWRARQ